MNFRYWSNYTKKTPKNYQSDLHKMIRRYDIKFHTIGNLNGFNYDDECLTLDVPFDKDCDIDFKQFIINFKNRFNIELSKNYINHNMFSRDRGLISFISDIELSDDNMLKLKQYLRKEKLLNVISKLKND